MSVLNFIIQGVLVLCGLGYLVATVWLVYRAIRRRGRRAVLVLTAWVLGVPALYIASIAPIIWLDSRFHLNPGGLLHRASTSYMTPVRLACDTGPASVSDAYWWYCKRLVPDSEDAESVASYQYAAMILIRLLTGAAAVAFAAFCLWLSIRVLNRRERWAKWTLSVVSLPVLYVATFGPACWVSSHWGVRSRCVSLLYQPLLEMQFCGWDELHAGLTSYQQWCAKDDWFVFDSGEGLVWGDETSMSMCIPSFPLQIDEVIETEADQNR